MSLGLFTRRSKGRRKGRNTYADMDMEDVCNYHFDEDLGTTPPLLSDDDDNTPYSSYYNDEERNNPLPAKQQ